jgi:trimethylamine monooxygenase
MYIGMQDQFYTFNMFDAQAWYARDVVLGRIKLPSKSDMFSDIHTWTVREESLGDASDAIDYQTEYVRDLIAPTDYPRLDVDGVAKMFKDWEHHKMDNILTYRDKSHRSLLTGTVAPVHHTPWMKALDDSMEAFLNQPDAKVAAE